MAEAPAAPVDAAQRRAQAEARNAAKTVKIDLDLKDRLGASMRHADGFAGFMTDVIAT